MTPDPFGTGSLRDRVLAAWVATPARFREDANAEDDVARTGYRDRLVVELAQNAADAAARAGVPGRLLLRLVDGTLYAANVGAPLDADGVRTLSHLRASAKQAGEVGRFGVGFKAVLAVCDAPAIVGRDGGVRWSRDETARLVHAVATPDLTAEVDRRGGHPPVMRLPFPAEPDAVARELLTDWDTAVTLPLRDADALEAATALLDAVDVTLLLFLPGLVELRIGSRVLRARRDGGQVVLDDGGAVTTWAVHHVGGRLPPELLADRPVEERDRPEWTATWAVPLDPDGTPRPYAGDRRLRAPQPTDEPLDLPALLELSVPLDTSRRHVVTGPLTDWLVERAGSAYADFLAALPPVPALVDLVPSGFPAGPLDLAVRDAVLAALPRTRWLAAAADPAHRLRPDEAVVVDCGGASSAVTALLAPSFPALVDPAWVLSRRRATAAGLGVRVLETADVVDLVHGLDQPPSWWAALYTALAAAPDRDALRALPVPLRDGRLVTGPRGLLLGADDDLVEAAAAAGLPLRFVHEDVARGAAAALLAALGAQELDPAALLDDLREAVERSLDDDPPVEPAALADVVLGLLARAPDVAADRSWLAELALPDTAGDWRPAGELLLPASAGGRLVDVVRPDSPFGVVGAEMVARWGADAVVAAGVLRTFVVVREADVTVDPDVTDHWLDAEDSWLAAVSDAAGGGLLVVEQLVAVRDLEWVGDWTRAWDELVPLRDTVTEPAVVVRPDGTRVRVPPYTAWWLRGHPCVPCADGVARPPYAVRAPAATGVLARLDPPTTLTGPALDLAVAVGVRRGGELAAEHVRHALATLPDAALSVDELRQACAALATAYAGLPTGAVDPPPDRVLALRGGVVTAVPASAAVVFDAPDLAPLLADVPVVPVPVSRADALADLLDVPLASEAVSAPVVSRPVAERPWPPHLPLADRAALGPAYAEHDPLEVAAPDGGTARVPWRVFHGRAHVDRAAGDAAVARAAAWLAGEWHRRDTYAAWLAADEVTRAHLAAESLGDE